MEFTKEIENRAVWKKVEQEDLFFEKRRINSIYIKKMLCRRNKKRTIANTLN